MKQGFNFSKIIDESFYQKTYLQNQVMGVFWQRVSCFWMENAL
ncbi:MAG: hypothetical protein ACLVB1_04920 [Blautia obeum]